MSLKNKFFSFLTVAISVAAFSTLSLAQEAKPETADTVKTDSAVRGEGRKYGKGKHDGFAGRHGGRGKHHGGMMRMLHGLNLTDVQKEQVKSIMQANKPDQATMEDVRTLARAKRDGTITAEQQERLTAFKAQAKLKAEGLKEQVLAILTTEQKAQMEQKKAEMQLRMKERRQKNTQTPATETPKIN